MAILLCGCGWGDATGVGTARRAQSAARQAIGGPLPGAPVFDESLLDQLADAWIVRARGYTPRTRHLQPDGSPKYTNRLFLESSPYLRQHSHNPLNWHPWGDEAFELARQLGRPVLLSVGYSTCHWCHVMEEESFDDEEIARYLNENYIAIKVDREVRPDIDAIYMTAVQMMIGSGGWPMTVWLTPDREPFSGGTYFPARDGDRGVSIGFLTMLRRMKEAYDEEPDRVAEVAAQIAQVIRENMVPAGRGEGLPEAQVLHAAAEYYRERFDSTYGGLAGAPKFPSGLSPRLLLRHHRRTGDEQSLEMATLTLEQMAAGGMYDHVGGGFHRYSTDEQWLVPHFEKMLYDNALLTTAYLEAYQATGREDFARVARELLRYVERDMTSPAGAFYSATDADSPGPSGDREEGWFFTWASAEVEQALDDEERARVVAAYYDVTADGNFEGRNIFHTPRPLAEVAEALGLPVDRMGSLLEQSREVLYAVRATRPAPLRDEKILTAWNGLMISALAHASLVLEDEAYAARAERAADFLLTYLRRDGRLLRSYADGRACQTAYLDDYAFLIAGLLDLYEATSDLRWLEEALALDRVLQTRYEDQVSGGFFRTSDDQESLLVREKPSYDGAEPSGNSVQLLNLVRMHEFTTDDGYRQRGERALRALEGVLTMAPAAAAEALLAVDYYLDTPKEIVIVTPTSRQDAEPLLAQLRATFLPNRILTVVVDGEDLAAQTKLIPLLEGKFARDGQATAYVCENRVCDLPTTDPDVFARQIGTVRPLP